MNLYNKSSWRSPKTVASPEMPQKPLLFKFGVPYPVPRKVTDKWTFFIFGACLLISVSLIMYTLNYTDINRLKGYDKCGNICDEQNKFNCHGNNDSYQDNLIRFGGDCIELYPIGEYNLQSLLEFPYFVDHFVLVTLVPLGMSIFMAILFSYAPSAAVLGNLFISVFYFGIASIISFIWALRFSSIPLLIFCSMVGIVLFLLISTWDRVHLSIVLYREAAKAISNIKFLYLLTILTVSVLLVLVGVSVIILSHLNTAGILKEVLYSVPSPEFRMRYVPDGLMTAGKILGAILMVWTINIVVECQYIVISGAISNWYRSRDPVVMNGCAILKCHFGSVILGSLVNSVITIPRIFFVCISHISIVKDMAHFFLTYFNGLTYSYVITADHGKPFFQSSKKTMDFNLKISDTVAFQSIGSFVNLLSQIFAVLITLLVLMFTQDGSKTFYGERWLLLYLPLGICFVCCFSILGPIQVAYHTIILCICQQILNEGANHSLSIKDYLTNSLQTFDKKV